MIFECSKIVLFPFLHMKNTLKMFWMQFFLQLASLNIIPQKSPIGQKFLTPCILKKNQNKWRFQNFLEYENFLMTYRCFFGEWNGRNFWPIGDFWGMMLSDAPCKRNRIQNIFRTFFMFRYMALRYFHISFLLIFIPKIAYFSIKNRFWIIFFILTFIISYNYSATII